MPWGTPWSTRIDPEYLPLGDLPPMALSRENLAAVRASLDERRAADVAVMDTHGVEVAEHVIGTGDREVRVRSYRPTADDRLPVVVYAHSGAYLLGNLDTDHRRCLDLARLAGCLLVSVDYRLAPEDPYPAALDDCFDVLAAVADDPVLVGARNADRSRLAVAGSSAGAGLAAATALRARDEEIGLRFQLLHQPMLDRRCAARSVVEFADAPYFDGHSARFAWAAYAGAAGAGSYLSPAETPDLTGLPPAFVTCSEVDPLRDEAIEYAARLLRAGVPTELRLHAGTCHGFDSVAPDAALSRSVIEEQAAALACALE